LNGIKNYEIHSFEPHPFFFTIREKTNQEDDKIKIIKKCATTHNNNSKFYYSTNCDGSSLNGTKITNGVNINNYFEVECCDLYEYYINNINLKPGDELWLKMDIEGEEYNLIPYLHKKGMLNNVSNLFIEWHYNKIKNISKEAHLNSVKLIKNIKTYNWDALNYSFKDTNSKYNTYMKNYTLHTDADK
jgi:FkbM family methyltransferase